MMRALRCVIFSILLHVDLSAADSDGWPSVLADVAKTADSGPAQAWLEGRSAAEYTNYCQQLLLTTPDTLPIVLRNQLIGCLMTRWAGVDVHGSLQALLSSQEADWLDVDAARRAWARGAWSNEDAMIGALRETRLDEASLQEILLPLAEQLPGPDVAVAYTQLKKLAQIVPVQELLRELIGSAASRCAALPTTTTEWQAARSFVAQLPPSEFRNRVSDDLWLNPPGESSADYLWQTALTEAAPARVQGWLLAREFRSDRESAWRRLQSVSADSLPSVEDAFVASVADTAPDTVSWLLKKQPAQHWSVRGLSVMTRYFLERQPGKAILWMRENANHLPDEVWTYAGQFAMEDLSFARFWLEVRCDTPERSKRSGYSYALRTMGKSDANEAIAWINAHLTEATRDLALVEQIRLWGASMPDKALATLRTIQSPDWFADGRSALVETWATRDFAAALEAAKAFPETDRLRAVSSVCEKGARAWPKEAAAAFVALLRETEATEKNAFILGLAADDVIDALYQAQGDSIHEWLRQTVPPAHRAEMARHAFHRIGKRAEGSLQAMLAALPEDEIKEVWRQESARYGFDTPWEAFQVAAQIRDAKRRQEICRDLTHVWKNLDLAFASVELPKVQLPEEEKAKLLSILAKP